MSRPAVAGVAGGVGTSTVAAALGADDLGVYGGRPVEALVCRSTVESVERAHRVIATMSTRPVLVVVADVPGRAPRGLRGLIRMVRPHVDAVIEVPFVASWRTDRRPVEQAREALSGQGGRELVVFARALQRLDDTLRRPRPVPARVVPADQLGRGESQGPERPPDRRRMGVDHHSDDEHVHSGPREDLDPWFDDQRPGGRRLGDDRRGYQRPSDDDVGFAERRADHGGDPRAAAGPRARRDPWDRAPDPDRYPWAECVGPDPDRWSREHTDRARRDDPDPQQSHPSEFGPGSARARPAGPPAGRPRPGSASEPDERGRRAGPPPDAGPGDRLARRSDVAQLGPDDTQVVPRLRSTADHPWRSS